MAYRVEVGPKARIQLDELNAAVMVHRRLVGMPDDLAGLCKSRVGDWRILYWIYHGEKIVRIYRIQHRSEVYRDL